MKLSFTAEARGQLLEGLAYVARDNPTAARSLRTKALAALERSRTFPASGRRFPEFPELPYREVIVRPYRFFYRVVRDDLIVVIAVWHGAQRPEPPPE